MTMPRSIDAKQRSTGGYLLQDWLREISPEAIGSGHSELPVPDHFWAMWKEYGTGGAVDIYSHISRAPGTAAPRLAAEIRTIDSLKLEKRVQLEREQALIDSEFIVFADTAVKEALAAIRRHNLSGADNVAMSEDGILSMQWRKLAIGAAIIFTGDGMVSVSTATPNKLYSQKPIRIIASDPLPREFLLAVVKP